MSRGLDDGTRREVAWNSRTLFERLAVDAPGTADADCEAADEFLSAWREAYDDAPPDAFEDRLAAADLDERTCRACACRDAWPAGEPLPDWLDDLDDLVAVADGFDGEPADRGRPYPFEDVLEPWVAYATDRLAGTAPQAVETGLGSLEAWLLERLLQVAAEPLFVEFKTFVAMRDPTHLFGDGPDGEPGTGQYEAFVERMRSADGLASLFGDYPVFARFVVTTVRQWVEAVAEFHGRLDADRERLERAFAPDDGLGALADVEAETGDRHGDGRAVLRVEFAGGPTLAYKPRSVEPECRFGDLLDWFGERLDGPGFEPPTGPGFVPPTTVAGDGYGWMEWRSREPCDTGDAVRRYYRRAGALAAVAYALGLTDLQFENLVAAGEWPVVVDAETVMQPPVEDAASGDRVVSEAIRGSVLGSRLLPWTTADGPNEDMGALTSDGAEARQPPHSMARWEHVNTDAMEMAGEVYRPETATNLPTLDGEPRTADEYADAVVAGFEAAYRRLHADRDALLADDGPLAAFADAETRFLYSTTDRYYAVIRGMTSPGELEDGVHLTGRFERLLAREFDDGTPGEPWRRLYRRERAALARLDVPRLTTAPASRAVFHDSRRVGAILDEPGLDAARRRLAGLDPETDLPRQVDEIRLALGTAPTLAGTTAVDPVLPGDPVSGEAFDEWATEIFDGIAATAREDGDGHPTWLLHADYDDGTPVTVRTPDAGLYKGRPGIALFAAALHAVHGDARYREWARDVLAPLRERVAGPEPFSAVGGVEAGVGAAVYALRTAAGLLGDDDLLADAKRAARHLDGEMVAADDRLDVVNGAAGTALALLALHDDCGEPWVLDRARTCGEHLLANRVETEAGVRTWETGVAGEPLAGFSHGAAGVSYALARLADATGEARFADAAVEGVEYERTLYDADRANWPDLREGSGFTDAWCHGRTGVGLARLATRRYLDDPTVEADVERAVDARRTDRLGPLDNLCCGNAGRAAFAAAAGTALDEPRYLDEARALAAATMRRADERGRLSLQSHTGRLHDPTLFQGTAGVGYALLRVVHPDVVPCLLRWE